MSTSTFIVVTLAALYAALGHGAYEDRPSDTTTNGDPVFADNFEQGRWTRGQAGGKWAPKTGRRVTVQAGGAGGSRFALDFFFPARPPEGMSSAEQRFELTERVKELWLEYEFYLPSNFYHREPKGGSNNKFLALWEEDYKATRGAPLIIVEFRPMGDSRRRPGKAGDSYLYVHGPNRAGRLINHWGNFAANAFSDAQRGRWNRVRVHARLATNDLTDDGLIELWLNGARIIEARNVNLPSAERHYLRRGYFMGWSNSGYNEDTHFKIDNVKFYSKQPPGW